MTKYILLHLPFQNNVLQYIIYKEIVYKDIYFQAAYVENLDGPQLFDSMYAEDVEGKKLGNIPGFEEALLRYPFWRW